MCSGLTLSSQLSLGQHVWTSLSQQEPSSAHSHLCAPITASLLLQL